MRRKMIAIYWAVVIAPTWLSTTAENNYRQVLLFGGI